MTTAKQERRLHDRMAAIQIVADDPHAPAAALSSRIRPAPAQVLPDAELELSCPACTLVIGPDGTFGHDPGCLLRSVPLR